VDRLDKKKQGANSTEKEKGGGGGLKSKGIFINIFEKCNLWIFIYPKFSRDGNESPSG
jgi:hypothetical protein